MSWKIWFPGINLWNYPKKKQEKIKVSFRVDPLSSQIRFYTDGIDHKLPLHLEHAEWYKIISVQHTDAGEIYFSGAKEGLTKKEYIELFKYFKSAGYLKGYYRHKNKELFVDFTKDRFNLITL